MASYATDQVRNVVFGGHSSTGKTTLMDAMLFKAGVVTRLGRPEEKSTVSDFEPDEKERGHSIYSALSHLTYQGKEINVMDVPGGMDFFGAAVGPFYAADLAIIAVDATRGVEVNTRRFWKLADDVGLPRVIVVTRMDAEHAKFDEALASIQESFGGQCKPYAVPDASGPSFTRVASVLDDPEQAQAKSEFIETAVEADDALLERYLEGEELTPEVLIALVPKALIQGTLVPVIPLSINKDLGVDVLLDFIARFAPAPGARERIVLKGETEVPVKPAVDGPTLAFVFKTVIDPFVGKINFFRVLSGRVQGGSSYRASTGDRPEKFGQVFKVVGKDQQNQDEIIAGDIGAVAKVESLGIGATLSSEAQPCTIKPFNYPSPMVSLAVEPQSRGDEQKLNQSLKRLSDEDPTFQSERNRQTKELVVRGLGTLHVDMLLNKMKNKYGVKVNTRQPKVPYLETITANAESRYRHKKQTGGAGQFGEVAIKIEPNERGQGFSFVNDIVGGVVPGQFIPSVEKGVANVLEEGILAGYPVVDVVVHLWDGKSHPVDSKDIAFQVAGREAFKEAFVDAKPTFLEPIGVIEITVPSEYMGDIIADLNTRRARIQGSGSEGNFQMIKAEVPFAEVATYSNDLRSITGGVGTYTLDFLRYDLVPPHLKDAIVLQAQKDREAK
jgi:elongation factor G